MNRRTASAVTFSHYLAPASLILLTCIALIPANPEGSIQSDKASLSPLQGLVGKWKGTGSLRRGSARGAWRENTTWAWKFSDGRASLVFSTPAARFLRKGKLQPGNKKEYFLLNAELPEGKGEAVYKGSRNKEGKLVMNLQPGKSDISSIPVRLTLSLLVKGKRLVALYEGRNKDSGRYYRLGEVGYTLSGATISKGTGQPECIVTGGRGTIRVEHDGKSYTVCCKGCLDAFREDPGAIIAEWAEKRKDEADKRRKEDKGKAGGK